MPKHKRGQRGSSSSSATSPAELNKMKMSEEEVAENALLKHLIQNLTETMGGNFGNLHGELSTIRQEIKHVIETVKDNVKNVEKSGEEVWATVDYLEEEVKALKDTKRHRKRDWKDCDRC